MIKSHYYIERCLEPIRILEANSSLEVDKICPSIFSTSALDMQSNIFKIIMKSNATITMEAPFHVNPLTRLWRTLVEAFRISRHSFFQTSKDCNSASVGVSGGWKNIFYVLCFMKSRLRNYLNEHLHIVIGIYSQTFYTWNTFPYGACFDDWKDQKPRRALN